MPVIINGTTGITDVNGTAAAPALTGTDTDTGIFFPAANTLAFSTNGTEDARFDSAGNFGLGVTPSAWGTSWKTLQLPNGVALSNISGLNALYLSENAVFANDQSSKYIASDFATLYQQYNGQHRWFNAASGSAGGTISFTQAMTLDASGNLGVGTTSPAYKVEVKTSTAASIVDLLLLNNGGGSNGGGAGLRFEDAGAAARVAGVVFGPNENSGLGLGFYTSSSAGSAPTEKARIDSSGNLLVGTTSQIAAGRVGVSYNGSTLQGIALNDTAGSSSAQPLRFLSNGTAVGTITTSTTNTAYNTSSDYRLKNTVEPMVGALAKVVALKPCTYKWNINGSSGEGFIAHELAEVCPQAVHGEKDAVDENGNPVYQGIDTSFLVATLTAAIQEQQAIITQLQADVAALKGTQP